VDSRRLSHKPWAETGSIAPVPAHERIVRWRLQVLSAKVQPTYVLHLGDDHPA
jgi:hypothetical protein